MEETRNLGRPEPPPAADETATLLGCLDPDWDWTSAAQDSPEELYARHNGHADLLREAIDGETGE